MDTSFIADLTVTKEDGSQVKIEGEIPFAVLAEQRETALQHLGKDVELNGFRKGHIPSSVLEKHIGEMPLLTEMAERALAATYPEMLKEHNLEPVGYPQVSISKLAQDNPLGFSITVATLPEITLPDYKAIAKTQNESKPSATVTDEDIENQINDILRRKVAYDRLQQKAAKESEATPEDTATADATDLPTPESEAKKTETETEEPITTQEELDNLPLPELTDELVQELGQPGQFENVDDFKAKLREHLTAEKEREVNQTHRASITDAIVAAADMELPQVLVDSELEQMQAQMQQDLDKNDLKMEDYLTHIKKSKEELLEEWRPAAEKRAKLQLILNEIAKAENVTPDEQLVAEQVKQLKEQYQDADEERVRVYVESILKNEAVMNLLEEQK